MCRQSHVGCGGTCHLSTPAIASIWNWFGQFRACNRMSRTQKLDSFDLCNQAFRVSDSWSHANTFSFTLHNSCNCKRQNGVYPTSLPVTDDTFMCAITPNRKKLFADLNGVLPGRELQQLEGSIQLSPNGLSAPMCQVAAAVPTISSAMLAVAVHMRFMLHSGFVKKAACYC